MKFYIATILIAALIAARTPAPVSKADVNQVQGIFIFTDSQPVTDFEYLGTVKKSVTFAGSLQYQSVRDRLIKKLKTDYPLADGAIFYFNESGADHCDAIKFK